MTDKFFRNRYSSIDAVVQCELDDADYVCAELYRRLLNLYSENLLYMASLEDKLEAEGIDLSELTAPFSHRSKK
jgi:hypothetical protein